WESRWKGSAASESYPIEDAGEFVIVLVLVIENSITSTSTITNSYLISAKKERHSCSPCLFSMGNGRRNGRLRGFPDPRCLAPERPHRPRGRADSDNLRRASAPDRSGGSASRK